MTSVRTCEIMMSQEKGPGLGQTVAQYAATIFDESLIDAPSPNGYI